MGLVFSSYFKGFAQLSDPKTRAVIWTSIGWSVAILVGLFIALVVILKITTFVTIGFLDFLLDTITLLGAPVLTWLLFPAVVTAVGSLMLDRVVDGVEARHYPDLPLAPGQALSESIGPALRFLGVTVGLNLLCLPLLLTPLFPFVYYALNGYLISREYFELVAFRRLSAADTHAMRQRWKMTLFTAGVGFAFMLTIPILNVIAPVIATAATVHLFEAWRIRDGLTDKPQKSGSGDVVLRTGSTDVADT